MKLTNASVKFESIYKIILSWKHTSECCLENMDICFSELCVLDPY